MAADTTKNLTEKCATQIFPGGLPGRSGNRTPEAHFSVLHLSVKIDSSILIGTNPCRPWSNPCVLFVGSAVIFLALAACATFAQAGPDNFRRPANDVELRSWLENMVWHHRFSTAEIAKATGLVLPEIDAALNKFEIRPETKPKRAVDAPLLVLPYPGGRHPRIGFLDGAVDPQRETKVSIFTPWDETSYVVADIPEAVWSNLGLTYLAHTHVPTIWNKQNIELEPLEWTRKPNGSFEIERKLPNGIVFGTRVMPGRDAVRMEQWLTNGTPDTLSDLRVQNCVMLKGAAGFEAQTNDNKVFKKPYVAARNKAGDQWIIAAWEPCDRAWGNAPCPCLHSDPKFPDCAPGETKRLQGWLSFFEGTDIDQEFRRIDATGWKGNGSK
jgi:hypothetical protein